MTFLEALDKYKFFLQSINQQRDIINQESAVESIKDWSEFDSVESVMHWFRAEQKKCRMVVEDIPLNDCSGWSFDNDKGTFCHNSGEFFYVQGVRVKNTDGREVVGGWDQPILTQVGFNGGLLGLLRKKIDNVPYYLVNAKAEPGNPDKVQISPTLQATYSNLKQAHKGNRPKFADLFESPDSFNCTVVFDQLMSEDGGRLHLKRNRGMIVEVNDSYDLPEINSSFKWLTLFQIKKLISLNSWVSPHVRSIISSL